MRPIHSRIDTGSAQYAENARRTPSWSLPCESASNWAISGGKNRDRSIERHLKRGKVMVRDRIDLVIDEGTPFLECPR